jgi:molybdenum cofactor cytidylyltransferase
MDELDPPDAARGAPSLRFGAVVLAAGAAARMGQPKQLLPIAGKPLLVRTLEALLTSRAWPIVVVTGAHAEQVTPLLAPFPVLIAENSLWPEGMGTSVRRGLFLLQQFSRALDGALLAVCDQPEFSAAAVDSLERSFTSSRSIVAARYAGTLGVPALFGREYFPELLALSGAEGARGILQRHAFAITPVDRPELAVDLDTPDDYRNFTDRT